MQFLGDCREVPEMPKRHPGIMRYKLIKCGNAVNDNAAPGRDSQCRVVARLVIDTRITISFFDRNWHIKRTAMSKTPRKPGHNVLQLPTKRLGRRPVLDFPADAAAAGALAVAGSPDDPRMQEALRLIEAFLAIEDASARAALIALSESLVSHDWVRRVQQR